MASMIHVIPSEHKLEHIDGVHAPASVQQTTDVRLHEDERILRISFLQVGSAGGQDDERSEEVWSGPNVEVWEQYISICACEKRVRF